MANITPIFKKGSRTQPSNNRPLSLLLILIKLMEKLIRDEISMHLISQKVLSVNQHGLVKGKSCATNLINTIHIVSEALNRGFTASIVFFDFLKSFDIVLHKLLLIKLEAYGFKRNLLR